MFEFIFLLNWFTFIGFLLSDFIINYGTYGYDHNKKKQSSDYKEMNHRI